MKTRNGGRRTGNGERGTGNGERETETGNGKRETRNGERKIRNRERGTGNDLVWLIYKKKNKENNSILALQASLLPFPLTTCLAPFSTLRV